MAVEKIVAEDQGTGLIAGEVGADDEGLGAAVGFRLHRVLDAQPQPAAVAEELAIEVDVLRTGDNEDFADIGQHQYR